MSDDAAAPPPAGMKPLKKSGFKARVTTRSRGDSVAEVNWEEGGSKSTSPRRVAAPLSPKGMGKPPASLLKKGAVQARPKQISATLDRRKTPQPIPVVK